MISLSMPRDERKRAKADPLIKMKKPIIEIYYITNQIQYKVKPFAKASDKKNPNLPNHEPYTYLIFEATQRNSLLKVLIQ